jgi:hypothetical protein
MAHQPIWWRCLACDRRFCVGEERHRPWSLRGRNTVHSTVANGRSETHPPMAGRWR